MNDCHLDVSPVNNSDSDILETSWDSVVVTYEACSEIIETLAFYPEHIDVGKQNSA